MGDNDNRFRSWSAKLTVLLGSLVIIAMAITPIKTLIANTRETANVSEYVKLDPQNTTPKRTIEGVQTIPSDNASQSAVTKPPATTPVEGAYGVSTSNPIAGKVAMEVLAQGGNAADAAAAAALVLTVVEPHASSLGGAGGALVYTPTDQKVTQILYREKSSKNPKHLGKKAGVPGMAKGLEYLIAQFGSVDEKTIIEPARSLATDGFKMDSSLFDIWKRYRFGNLLDAEANNLFFPNGIMKTFVTQPELSKTLTYLQENGLGSFYEEPFAKELVSQVSGLDVEDITSYGIQVGEAIKGDFQGWDVYTASPPMSGVTFIQMLNMIEQVGLENYSPDSAEYYHFIADITNLAYRSRFLELADPSVDPINTAGLISKEYSQRLSSQIKPGVKTILENDQYTPTQDSEINPEDPTSTQPATTAPDEGSPAGTQGFAEEGVNPYLPKDMTHTTHLVVVDKTGMMVSMTNTIGTFFGTGDFPKGFFMNNLLTNFNDYSENPGYWGVDKSPRSFTTPSILIKDGQILGLGSPGGARIPAMMAQGVANFAYYNLPLNDAMERYRIFGDKDVIKTETPLNGEVTKKLNAMGYRVTVNSDSVYFGGIQALLFDPVTNTVDGASDSRRGGVWNSNRKKTDLPAGNQTTTPATTQP